MNGPTYAQKHLLILDTSVIINFLIINRWSMLLQSRNYQMASHILIIEQIKRAPRKSQPRESISRGELQVVDEPIPQRILTSIPAWLRQFGQQDTAVLVNAIALDAWIAADDRGLANEALRQGVSRVLTTDTLLADTIMQGQISLLDGNRHLAHLRRERFSSKHTCLCLLCGATCTCTTS